MENVCFNYEAKVEFIFFALTAFLIKRDSNVAYRKALKQTENKTKTEKNSADLSECCQ